MYENILLIIGIILIATIWSIKMIHLAIKIIITVLAVLLILNFFGILGPMNQPMNKLIFGVPDTSCAYDTDCKLERVTTCGGCHCETSAVNKDWNMFCPFRDNVQVQCDCIAIGPESVRCVKNVCQKVLGNATI